MPCFSFECTYFIGMVLLGESCIDQLISKRKQMSKDDVYSQEIKDSLPIDYDMSHYYYWTALM